MNGKYLSINWNASGGGAFAVIPVSEVGKLPDQIPLFRGHTGPVLDTDWNPFDDDVVASASDDAKVGIWRVPEGFTTRYEDVDDIKDIEPVKKLSGHTKKVGHVLWHPTARDVLASSSGDFTVKIWNVETGEAVYTLEHPDLIQSMSFNYDGTLLATTCRDKKLRVWDVRKQEIVSEGPGHGGAKSSRVVWLGHLDRIATTGFSKLSDRQIALWDTNDIAKGPLNGFTQLDSSAGINMVFYDEGTQCLYLGGKGDGNIRYFEYADDRLYPLSQYQSTEPQRGLAVVPKRSVDVREHELMRFYKTIRDHMIEPISFMAPRKSDTFQADIYPDARAAEPALEAADFFAGKTANPKVISLEAIYDGAEAKAFVAKEPPVPKKSVDSLRDAAKAESKPDAKSEVKTATKTESKAEPKQATPPPAQPSTDKIFASKDVSSFLDKASEKEGDGDDEPDTVAKNEESAWNSEDDEPVRKETKAESKPEPKAEPKDEPKTEPKAELKTETETNDKAESSVNGVSKIDTPETPRSLQSKKSFESPRVSLDDAASLSSSVGSVLHSLQAKIDQLTGALESVIEESKDKDRRIEALEQQLGDLLKK